jgi:hypothetical protein
MVALILGQVTVYVAWPPPAFDGPALPWLELLRDNRPLGLLSLSLLYFVDNALLIVMYLALYVTFRRTSESAMLVDTVLGLVGVAAYYASNKAFEMLYLSGGCAGAATKAKRAAFLEAGEAALAAFRGPPSTCTTYSTTSRLAGDRRRHAETPYLQQGDRLRGARRGRPDGGAVQRGDAGRAYPALASLPPWAVFSVLVARKLFRLGRAS